MFQGTWQLKVVKGGIYSTIDILVIAVPPYPTDQPHRTNHERHDAMQQADLLAAFPYRPYLGGYYLRQCPERNVTQNDVMWKEIMRRHGYGRSRRCSVLFFAHVSSFTSWFCFSVFACRLPFFCVFGHSFGFSESSESSNEVPEVLRGLFDLCPPFLSDLSIHKLQPPKFLRGVFSGRTHSAASSSASFFLIHYFFRLHADQAFMLVRCRPRNFSRKTNHKHTVSCHVVHATHSPTQSKNRDPYVYIHTLQLWKDAAILQFRHASDGADKRPSLGAER